MDMVDARAVTAGTTNLDMAAAYDTILGAVKAAAPEAGAKVEQGLAALESQAKFSLRKGLLDSLAGPVVFYSLGMGAVSEAPLGGAVVLVKLKDADLFEKTMTSLGDFVTAQSKGAFQASAQKRENGRTVHTWTIAQLAMMQVTPTWSVANGYAVIGLNPGVYEAAVKRMAATGAERKSIRDTPGYKEVTARLPDNVVALSYADSQTQYTQAMAMFQQFWPMAGLFAAQANIKLPPVLPSLSDIIKDMKPACRYRWVAPDGIYAALAGPRHRRGSFGRRRCGNRGGRGAAGHGESPGPGQEPARDGEPQADRARAAHVRRGASGRVARGFGAGQVLSR